MSDASSGSRPAITAKHSRNALDLYLPVAKAIGAVVFVCGIVWWVANQSRDITDARRVAEEASSAARDAASAARAAAADNAASQVKQAEILTRLSGIETQLAELRSLMLRGRP